MRGFENAEYRLRLAEGFLAEAEQDRSLSRWRSCVDNAQLSIENAGKTALALWGVAAKTHDPAQPLATLLRSGQISAPADALVQQMLPHLLAFGAAEHFMTDYGDEATGTVPWDLFTEISAQDVLTSARSCVAAAQQLVLLFAGPKT